MGRVLLLVPTSPWQTQVGGGEQRALLKFEAIREICEVDVLVISSGRKTTIAPGDRPECLGILQFASGPVGISSLWSDGILVHWSSSAIQWSRYSVVLGTYVTSVIKLGVPEWLPCIVDADNAVWRYGPFIAGVPHHRVARLRSKVRTRLFRRSLRECDYAFFCSKRDRETFPETQGAVLPNIPLVIQGVRSSERVQAPVILFVGSLWTQPNFEGVNWFVQYVWTAVRRRHPTAVFRLIGAVAQEVRDRWCNIPGVQAVGYVPDITCEYSRASFTVAPIWSGGGTNIKILESFAYGKAAVVTRFAYEVFKEEFREGKSILVADDASSMIELCSDLLKCPRLCEQIAVEGNTVVRKTFNRQEFVSIVHRALRPFVNSEH